ncbi:MAG TPA: MFS transporter, partial [Bauldia sp.]|nr:MFS transporter [Bauldia sp.]
LPIADGLWIPLAVLFGVTTLPTYAVAAAHAYDHAPPGGYVATAAGLLLANGVGAIVGPILAAALMERTSTAMLFLFTAFAQSGLALFAIARMKSRAAPTVPEKTEFDLAATAPVGAVIPPEPLDPADGFVIVPDGARPAAAREDGGTPGRPDASP